MHKRYFTDRHWRCEMDYPPQCFNAYRNISYQQRAQTLQPIRGDSIDKLSDAKRFMLEKYFMSLKNAVVAPVSTNLANYANVPPDHPDISSHNPTHTINQRSHLNYHSRSQSQHYYNNMQQMNDLNSYYNVGATNFARCRNPSTVNDIIFTQAPLDNINLLQVCNELGILDCPPPIPMSRGYSLTSDGMYKIMFPHYRIMTEQFYDSITGITVPIGARVYVLGPSEKDRSKFTVCYNSERIDIPYKLTQPPHLPNDFR